jgi:uncharacterized protein (TIGR04551 family)
VTRSAPITTVCGIAAWLCCTAAIEARAAEPAFTELGADLDGNPAGGIDLHGELRTRGEALRNLDLDRGLDPTGHPLYPVPPSDPAAQWLTHADLRARLDLSLRPPRTGAGAYLRLDLLDNVQLGSAPDGPPAAATGQVSPPAPLRVHRAYGVIALPIGVLAIGRMSAHWGLGIAANGGDGLDADHGTAADRLAFVTPLAGHVWALAYDLGATGPQVARVAGARTVDWDPSDDVRSWTLAVLRVRTEVARSRRERAGRTTFEYGVAASRRTQQTDAPTDWLGVSGGRLGPQAWTARDLSAHLVDGWLRLSGAWGRVEAEGVFATARIGQPSLVPGVAWRQVVESQQWGAALQCAFNVGGGRWQLGVDGGAASGDPAPGWGVFAGAASGPVAPGGLRGSQIVAPADLRQDEFAFHPNFRVDRLLFKELVGTVADAAYLRPHAAWQTEVANGAVRAEVAAVASRALEAQTTPGGDSALGLEFDPALDYTSRDGVRARLEYALLLPGAGFDNRVAGLSARPAQALRLLARIGW